MNEMELQMAIAERAIEDLRHRTRNDRQAVTFLEHEVEVLRRELIKLKAQLYAGITVALSLGPVFVWLFDFLLKG